jgi:hypothetical protein
VTGSNSAGLNGLVTPEYGLSKRYAGGDLEEPEAAMSHAELVRDGLFFFVVFLTLLLVLFIGAAVRAPAEQPGARSQPAAPPIQPDLDGPGLTWPRTAATWPPAGATTLASDNDYLPRHATPGGPPWGPAPRPPGLID